MSGDENLLIRNISDTARWAAFYRAAESERPDRVFNDPYARRLCGERGEKIAEAIKFSTKHSWSWVARTVIFDRFIEEQIKDGIDMVVNLAAGLDARPYRMELPKELQWVEVDLPGILDHKEEILRDEIPKCRLERVRLDLSDVSARRRLFERLGKQAAKTLVITEGLVIYLDSEQVIELAKDLATPAAFRFWLLDLTSPKILKMLQRNMGKEVAAAGSPLKFSPEEGLKFFEPLGWKVKDAVSNLSVAGKINRLKGIMKIWGWLPDTKFKDPKKPWGGGVLLEKR